jgi:hypothetical protein
MEGNTSVTQCAPRRCGQAVCVQQYAVRSTHARRTVSVAATSPLPLRCHMHGGRWSTLLATIRATDIATLLATTRAADIATKPGRGHSVGCETSRLSDCRDAGSSSRPGRFLEPISVASNTQKRNERKCRFVVSFTLRPL